MSLSSEHIGMRAKLTGAESVMGCHSRHSWAPEPVYSGKDGTLHSYEGSHGFARIVKSFVHDSILHPNHGSEEDDERS